MTTSAPTVQRFRWRRVVSTAALLLLTAFLPAECNGLGFDDLVVLSRSGLGDALILEQVTRLGLGFSPTPAVFLALREAGLGESLLRELVEKVGVSTAPPSGCGTVRIFEQIDADGRRVLVLTNLDENGNRMRDPEERRTVTRPPEPEAAPGPAPAARSGVEPVAAPLVVVEVHVEQPRETGLLVGPAWTGGLVGPYRYPDRLSFLGYSGSTASPSWFSGLGLNPSNHFGHRPQDKPSGSGFDDFFGPPRR